MPEGNQNMFEGKTFFITGSAGFIGSNLVRRLSEENVKIIGTYNENLPRIANEKTKYVKLDLRVPGACDSYLKDVDYLIMAAGYVGGASSINNSPERFITDSTIININTLESAYRNRVKKCIFISSSMVYPFSEESLDEQKGFLDEPYEKYFSGGWGKRIGEVFCKLYAKELNFHMNAAIIRVDNIYGPYDDFSEEKSHVIASLIRKAVNAEDPFEIWGTGEEIKDFLYIDDLVNGILLALNIPSEYEVFNIASGHNVSINDVAEIIIKICNYKPEIVYNQSKPSTIPYKKISIKKATEVLGFSPKKTLEDGIRETILWYDQNLRI